MQKKLYLIFLTFFAIMLNVKAQETKPNEFSAGIIFQKTNYLYCENGIGGDFTSDLLLQKRIHLKASYVTSRLGSALFSNGIKQDNFVIGAEWRFRHEKPFQIFAGLNTGYFYADYEDPIFDMLPNSSMLLSAEFGLAYNFNFPVTINLSSGYNFISGNGFTSPGTLFPVFYKLGIFYKL